MKQTNKSDETDVFRVYVPKEKRDDIINKYISYAKLHYNNQVWKVMEKAFELLKEKDQEAHSLTGDMQELTEKVNELESRVVDLESSSSEEEGDEPKTMKRS